MDINELESSDNPYEKLDREELLNEISQLNSDWERWENDDAPSCILNNLWLAYAALDKKA